MKSVAREWRSLNIQSWQCRLFWRFVRSSMYNRLHLLALVRYFQKHLRQEVRLMCPLRQEVFLWEIQNTPELPETVQRRCRDLLSHMLLAAISGTIEEESDEREDPTDPHRA
jgi:hypothetical protein